MGNKKYIIICIDNNGNQVWNNNIIYHGEKATKIPALIKLKQKYPESKIYKLTEIRL